nr:7490_t:CDS:2 [Entrophospora candida]
MKSTLQPSSGRNYCLIVGEHGTGKTTLIRKTILNLQEPKGVVLFECPTDAKAFATNLTRHLDCELYPSKLRDIIMQWITNITNAIRKEEHPEYPTWNLLKEYLINTAFCYRREYKRPMVLVLDQVDRIAKKDQEFLGILQDFAKDCADKHALVIIFVASEGLVTQLMRSIIPLEVGDISDKEAVKLLKDSGTDQKTAEDAVKYLTGGRFALLTQFQSLSRYPKILFEEFKEQLFTQVKRDLDMVELPENHESFIKLIEIHRIGIQQAKTIIPLNMLRKLVKANILKEHQDYTVSFHSRYIDTYFKEVILADNIAI